MTDGEADSITEGSPIEVYRQNEDLRVNAQYQVTQQGKEEISASYQHVHHYDDGTEVTGVSLSLFIKDTQTARMLYECLRDHVEEGRI